MDERAYEDRRTTGVHKVYLNARKTAVMSGVRDVLSFDAKEVYLETEQGILLIRGDELHVNRLSCPSRRIHRKIRSRPISRNTDRCFRLKFVQRRLQKHTSHDKIDILLQNFAAGPTHVLPYRKEYLRKRRSVH